MGRLRQLSRSLEAERDRAALLRSSLADDRDGRVVFVSHCLLNENTRYPGGAFRRGAVSEVVGPYLRDGVGICQMPCPEQAAWGGLDKPHLVWFWGRPRAHKLAKLGLKPFLLLTRWRYRRLARHVAQQIADHHSNNVEVIGVVGVGASPSCGVATTADVAVALEPIVGCPVEALCREGVNAAIATAARPGQGIFTEELQRSLGRRGLTVPFLEHDLRSEWPNSEFSPGAQPVNLEPTDATE